MHNVIVQCMHVLAFKQLDVVYVKISRYFNELAYYYQPIRYYGLKITH